VLSLKISKAILKLVLNHLKNTYLMAVLFDEDITTLDALLVTNSTPSSLEGPMTRSRARHLNFEVPSFLMLHPNIHEDGMLLKSFDVLLLRNMGSENTLVQALHQVYTSNNDYIHKTEFS